MVKKLNLKNLSTLSADEMKAVKGGVDRATYCNTLCTIITGGCYSAACLSAWGMNCSPYGVKCY